MPREAAQQGEPGPVQLVLPATSANLGPAFAAAALALSLYLRVHAEIAAFFSVSAQGRDAHQCGGGEENLIVHPSPDLLRAAGKAPAPLPSRAESARPLGHGCCS